MDRITLSDLMHLHSQKELFWEPNWGAPTVNHDTHMLVIKYADGSIGYDVTTGSCNWDTEVVDSIIEYTLVAR